MRRVLVAALLTLAVSLGGATDGCNTQPSRIDIIG